MRYVWKKTVAAVAAAVALAVAAPAAHAICGDVNNNGTVDIADAVAMANFLASGGTACAGANAPTCNVYRDFVQPIDTVPFIDTTDLTNLVAQIAGLKTLFPACTGPGRGVATSPTNVVACSGSDTDTGLPVHNVGGVSPVTISANEIWPNTCTIHIQGIVYVQTPVNSAATVLTVQPGTVVKGEAGGTGHPAVLIVLPGAKIDAQGLPDQPIIMTSGAPIGSRQTGDWGGLLLNGKSTVNRPNCTNTAEGIAAPYGGCDATDSSGIVTYTRVEFSGIEFSPNNELNIITLNGVGNGTTLHHIQGNAGGDDCIEWFGGTVNVKYLVSSGCADDGFDWQLGTTGFRQYGLQVQYGPFLQTGNQSRGMEADNSEFGFDDLPRSNPKFCNVTMIGARDNDPNLGSQGGLFFRRGTAGNVANGIVMNYRDGCIRLDDATTSKWACTAADGTLKTTDPFLAVQNTVCYDNGGTGAVGTAKRGCAGALKNTSGAVCGAPQWVTKLQAGKAVVAGVGTCTTVTAPFLVGDPCCQDSDCGSPGTCGSTSVGPNPQITGWGTHATRWLDVLASGGGYPANVPDLHPTSTTGFPAAADCGQIDPFFDNAGFIGAFNPNGSNNWIDTPQNTQPYASGFPINYKRWISFDTN